MEIPENPVNDEAFDLEDPLIDWEEEIASVMNMDQPPAVKPKQDPILIPSLPTIPIKKLPSHSSPPGQSSQKKFTTPKQNFSWRTLTDKWYFVLHCNLPTGIIPISAFPLTIFASP